PRSRSRNAAAVGASGGCGQSGRVSPAVVGRGGGGDGQVGGPPPGAPPLGAPRARGGGGGPRPGPRRGRSGEGPPGQLRGGGRRQRTLECRGVLQALAPGSASSSKNSHCPGCAEECFRLWLLAVIVLERGALERFRLLLLAVGSPFA